MKCQKCEKPAIYHITELTGGEPQELHLCEDHAKLYLSEATNTEEALQSISATVAQEIGMTATASLGETVDELKRLDQETCPLCGLSFHEFRNKGRFGCPHDYEKFAKQLEPLMMNIHGGTEHIGKTPQRLVAKRGKTTPYHDRMQLIRLRREMAEAVAKEHYERASQLRDEILTIEKAGE